MFKCTELSNQDPFQKASRLLLLHGRRHQWPLFTPKSLRVSILTPRKVKISKESVIGGEGTFFFFFFSTHTHKHTRQVLADVDVTDKAVNMVKRLEITKSLSVDTPKKGFAEWSLRGKLHYAFFQEKTMDTKLCLHLLTNTVVLPYMAFDPSPKKNMLQPCYNLSGFVLFLFLFFVFSR